jgi:2,3-dihydroxyphenylpropionate 1,2-dioxygenase
MPADLICTSHTPLTNVKGMVSPETEAPVRESLAALRQRTTEFAPDLVVQFGSDHNSGLNLGLMPAFLVAIRAKALGDYYTSKGQITVDEANARALVSHLHSSGVDVATSYDLTVDHGFTWVLDEILGGINEVPVIPIFTNCGGDLRPPFRRSLALGHAVGEFLRDSMPDSRVLILSSGGLSHDPDLPQFLTATPEVQQRMIEGIDWNEEALLLRTERLVGAGKAFERGETKLRALNPDWDREILELLRTGDLEAIGAMEDQEVIREGGRGGAEIRNWLAAFAAIRAYGGGHYDADVVCYRDIPAWIIGFGIMHAQAAAAH